MKIGFVSLDHLRDWSGITRLIDRIAADMARREHLITIIALDKKANTKTPVSELNYPHELLPLNLDDEQGILEAREKIKSAKLDICAASIGSSQLELMPKLFYGSGIPFIHGEPADPRVFTYERWNPYLHFGALYTCAAIQVLLPEYIPLYPKLLQPRITVIGNPTHPPADVDFTARRSKETRYIIAVGRLNEPDKRYSVLLRAFALLSGEFPQWRLKIVGDGPFREFYHEMARQLGIKKLIDFTGAVADTASHYNSADIFCLPSFRAEGLPMVFGEAASHALPMVGFKSCTASAALIKPDIGVLADNGEEHGTPEQLAEALRALMTLVPEEREKYGIRAREFFTEELNEQKIFDKWETTLMDTFENWKGLEPDSDVWTEEVLAGTSENAEIVRLQCENARLKQDYDELGKRYSALLGQFQALAGKKGKR